MSGQPNHHVSPGSHAQRPIQAPHPQKPVEGITRQDAVACDSPLRTARRPRAEMSPRYVQASDRKVLDIARCLRYSNSVTFEMSGPPREVETGDVQE